MMYRFNKVRLDNGSWRFELNGINLILEDFELRDEKHWIQNISKAIGYFSFKGEFYSVCNQSYKTAEDFYNIMQQQYAFFNTSQRLKSA